MSCYLLAAESCTTKACQQSKQHAADKWDSARFSSLFLALSFFRSPADSRLAHLGLMQAVETVEKVGQKR